MLLKLRRYEVSGALKIGGIIMSQAYSDISSGRKSGGFSVRDIALTSMFAVIIAVCSWISLPLTVPFTLQTFAVFCALSMMGAKRGTFAVLVYILLGAVGIPVFAGFSSGIGVLLGSTGGYIVGFLCMGLIYFAAEKIFGNKMNDVISAVALIIGMLVMYAFGTAWFIRVYTDTEGAVTLGEALKWCVIPFIVPDLAKLAAALVISNRVKKFVRI